MASELILAALKSLFSGAAVLSLAEDIKSGKVSANEAAKVLLNAFSDANKLNTILIWARLPTETEQALMDEIADIEAAIASLNRERKLEHFFSVSELNSKLYQAKFALLDELLKRFK